MKTLISGHAGLAVLVDGQRAMSFHVDGPQVAEREPQEIARLFDDAPDVIAVEGLTKEAIPKRLELEWSKNRCLLLCLLLLDADSDPEARVMAVPDIEEFLTDSAVFDFIAGRFYVAPLPDSADLLGSIVRASDGGAGRLRSLLEEIAAAQEEIARCREAWDVLPVELFGDPPSKEAMAFELVQTGVFRKVAAADADQRNGLLIGLLHQPSSRQFKGWCDALLAWIQTLAISSVTSQECLSLKDAPAKGQTQRADNDTARARHFSEILVDLRKNTILARLLFLCFDMCTCALCIYILINVFGKEPATQAQNALFWSLWVLAIGSAVLIGSSLASVRRQKTPPTIGRARRSGKEERRASGRVKS